MFVSQLIAVLLLLISTHCVESKRSKVITITGENWRDTLEGEWVIKFYAPWCPACRSMEEDYKQFADWTDDLNIKVGEVNINEQAGLSGRFIVTALPSIYHAKDGEFRRYVGNRDTNSFHAFIADEIWATIEPVPWYRHPDSIPMTLMSGLFQTSVIMKNFHETLTETYGFSNVTSYVIFAIATIATGLLLGLVMVFIIDCVAPPKPRAQPVSPESKDYRGAGDSAERDTEDDDDGKSTGRESLSGSEREEESEKGDGDGSEGEDGKNSRASSQSSSRTSQEWEQVQSEEAKEAESELSVERNISADKEEGQGEVRKRNVPKSKDAKDE